MRGFQWRLGLDNIALLKFWLASGTMDQVNTHVAQNVLSVDLGIYEDLMCDEGVDVWAAGCTAFELATGRFLFQPKVSGALVKVVLVQHPGESSLV